MAKLNWDATGERFYHAGVDRGVLYPSVGPGLVWNGLISIEDDIEIESGEKYVDGVKYNNRNSVDSFAVSLEAFSYPPELDTDPGPISFTYRTLVGNDTDEIGHGYLIHIVYNSLFESSTKAYQSLGESTDPIAFSWKVTTTPMELNGLYSAHLVIDTRLAYSWAVEELEKVIYGSTSSDPKLPTPEELYEIFEDASILKITDHGDGTWTAEGPDHVIQMIDSTSFEITWPSAIYLDPTTYKISSL